MEWKEECRKCIPCSEYPCFNMYCLLDDSDLNVSFKDLANEILSEDIETEQKNRPSELF